MSDRWYSALQLAGQPGMPTTERNVRARADRERWTSRQRIGRGGGREYSESSLPEATRQALQRRAAISAANRCKTSPDFQAGASLGRRRAIAESIDAAARQRQRDAGAAKAAGLSGRARERMNAKLDLLARLDQFAQHHGLGICAARDAFCSAYQAGEIIVDDAAKAAIGDDVSPATLLRWQRTLETQGAAALAGAYGNRSGTSSIESTPELRDFVLGLLTDKPHTSAANMQLAIEARFATRDVRIPSERSTARFLARFKSENAQLYTAIANPDAWKNRYMSAFGSASEDVLRLNQRWEFDSTPADVMLVDGRHTIVQIVDIWSRRRLFYVSKSSSSEAVSQAFRRALLAWGVPEQAKIDNGKDYVSERSTRGFTALGIEMLISPPFSPWKKPHVESGFRTFSHSLLEMLPGYLGHDVADQQAVRASKSFAERLFKKNTVIDIKLTAAELQSFCDRWCRDLYQHQPREGLNGQSVFQRVASWTGEVRRIGDERTLDLLLAEAPDGNGGRTVTKKGIRVDRLTYIAPELHGLVGERVQVLYDERDVGRIVVYHNGEFCCVAECPEVLGVSRAEIAAEAAAQRKAGIAAQRAEMRRLQRKADTTNIAFEILDAKARENAALASLSLADNVVHLTPAIAAAQEAAEAMDATPARPEQTGAEQLLDLTAIRDLRRSEQAQDETAETRFVALLDVLMTPETERNDIERQRLKNYFDSAEFQGRWTVFESFGPSAFQLDDKYLALLGDGAFAHRFREAQLKGSF